MRSLANIALFQVGWFACVLAVAAQIQWYAVLFITITILTHFMLSQERWNDVKIILIAGLTGLVVDSLLISQQVFSPNHVIQGHVAPPWLVGLWCLFGITVNHSLRWFRQHLLLAGSAGFVFAPLAYWAGDRFGVLSIAPGSESQLIAYITIGLCWSVITPVLLLVSQRLEFQNNSSEHNKYAHPID